MRSVQTQVIAVTAPKIVAGTSAPRQARRVVLRVPHRRPRRLADRPPEINADEGSGRWAAICRRSGQVSGTPISSRPARGAMTRTGERGQQRIGEHHQEIRQADVARGVEAGVVRRKEQPDMPLAASAAGTVEAEQQQRVALQASIPSGASTSRLNACISRAPSAPSMARWSKLPVALMMVAICRLSSIT